MIMDNPIILINYIQLNRHYIASLGWINCPLHNNKQYISSSISHHWSIIPNHNGGRCIICCIYQPSSCKYSVHITDHMLYISAHQYCINLDSSRLAEDVQRHRLRRQLHVLALQAAVQPQRLGGLDGALRRGSWEDPWENHRKMVVSWTFIGKNHGKMVVEWWLNGNSMGCSMEKWMIHWKNHVKKWVLYDSMGCLW